jgi:hypothetical protein
MARLDLAIYPKRPYADGRVKPRPGSAGATLKAGSWKPMLLDHRTYTVRPGTMSRHLKIYETYGFEVQKKYLGEPLVYLVTESGELDTFVHIWVYQDATDRTARRAALQADPAWQTYLAKKAEAGCVIKQKNKLMTPAEFAPIKR